MGNSSNINNINPITTEITDYYDLDKFDLLFNDELNKFRFLDDFLQLKKGFESFICLNKNQGFIFYKKIITIENTKKIFIKIYYLERINNKIRYSSLQIYDSYFDYIDYLTFTKNTFNKHFDFLNIQFDQVHFFYATNLIDY